MSALLNFNSLFTTLTGHAPFPWQQALYDRFLAGDFPQTCTLPTGLGKTSIIPIWLIALAHAPSIIPRRLAYVVNRRTVVDQATDEVKNVRERLNDLNDLKKTLAALCSDPAQYDAKGSSPLAISTLRGQFADNAEWTADPARPAVITGTVDMIGSRLLFSGYGTGFKRKPLHAGFLGHDVLLVHDEAHLEPAFQTLIEEIRDEQRKEAGGLGERMKVMALTATSRGCGEAFPNDDERKANEAHPEVQKRITAKKTLYLHGNRDEKKLAEEIADLALRHKDSDCAVLVFVRKVDDVERVVKKLPKGAFERLTGTLRGRERDALVKKPIVQRLLPPSNRDKEVTTAEGTVYLVCTSAGEVGVNISADHMVCDLSTFDSMAQRFGRVNRFGDCSDTRIDIVCPKEFKNDDLGLRLKRTKELLDQLDGDGSPAALDKLPAMARAEAFAPPPTILPTSDILFDSWALTTVRERLPGRPFVEPYLHGISAWEPPETHVAWREEVGLVNDELREQYKPANLLQDYPLKPHELLRDNSARVFDRLRKLKAAKDTAVWLVSDDDTVNVTTLGKLIEAGKEELNSKTLLLPPAAGGLEGGMLNSDSETANDVADDWFDERGDRHRLRIWSDDDFIATTNGMRPIRQIDFSKGEEDEGRYWIWFERPEAGDNDGSRTNKKPVAWDVHVQDVEDRTRAILNNLLLQEHIKDAIITAARFHDHGKRRPLFQRILGNTQPNLLLAKSGRRAARVAELYRHEFGSLLDIEDEPDFRKLTEDMQDLVLHLIAAHHGRARPHFPSDEVFDPEPRDRDVDVIAAAVPRRFAKLQRKYGRWGLAYLESLLRAADYAASARPVPFRGGRSMINRVAVDPTNPGQFFACCGLLELADRLWPQTDDRPAAEGWFTEGTFNVICGGTLRELLVALTSRLPKAITRLDNDLPVKQLIAPAPSDARRGRDECPDP